MRKLLLSGCILGTEVRYFPGITKPSCATVHWRNLFTLSIKTCTATNKVHLCHNDYHIQITAKSLFSTSVDSDPRQIVELLREASTTITR